MGESWANRFKNLSPAVNLALKIVRLVAALITIVVFVGAGWLWLRDALSDFLTADVNVWHLLVLGIVAVVSLLMWRRMGVASAGKQAPVPITSVETPTKYDELLAEVRSVRTIHEESQRIIREYLDDIRRQGDKAAPIQPKAPGGRRRADLPTLAIDVDTVGNDPRLQSGVSVTDRAEIEVGATIEIDIVVAPNGIPVNQELKSFQMTLQYDPSVVIVTAANPSMLINANPGSSVFGTPDPVPNSSGSYTVGALDVGTAAGETGPGVLVRLTLQGKAPGTTDLTLRSVGLFTTGPSAIPIGEISKATVTVRESSGAGR